MQKLFFNMQLFFKKITEFLNILFDSKLVFALVALLVFASLFGIVKGEPGSPNNETLNDKYWIDTGPLELSPDRGRFALTYSLAEDKSVAFSLPVARFATPDLGFKNGKYVSLFAPGVSIVILPGYLVGKIFGFAQFGTYLMIAIFAYINFWLVYLISRKLGAKKYASLFGAGIFNLATPALAYAGSLYQHHISVFLILLSVWLLLRYKSAWSLIPVWFLIGASVAIDNPNFFMMAPLGIIATSRMFDLKKIGTKFRLEIKFSKIIPVAAILLPIAGFMYFNLLSNGGPFNLSGTVEAIQNIDENGKPVVISEQVDEKNVDVVILEKIKDENRADSRSALGFFDTRNMLEGFYTQFFSRDRGTLFFAPIILIGFLGIVVAYGNFQTMHIALVGILLANLAIYSMWGDPWGGWAFGSRYLIPAYAVLAIFSSIILSMWNRKLLFVLLLLPLLTYSTAVNMTGALTTNRNPPQVEVLALEKISGKEEKFTFERNWDYLQKDSKSFVYKHFLITKWSPVNYYYVITSISILVLVLLLALNFFDRGKK